MQRGWKLREEWLPILNRYAAGMICQLISRLREFPAIRKLFDFLSEKPLLSERVLFTMDKVNNMAKNGLFLYRYGVPSGCNARKQTLWIAKRRRDYKPCAFNLFLPVRLSIKDWSELNRQLRTYQWTVEECRLEEVSWHSNRDALLGRHITRLQILDHLFHGL